MSSNIFSVVILIWSITIFGSFSIAHPGSLQNPGFSSDTTFYTQIFDGEPWGEWKTWHISEDTLGYVSNLKGTFQKKERLVLNKAGIPVFIDIRGKLREGFNYLERFEFQGDSVARVITLLERAHFKVKPPAFYAAIYPAHDIGVLARALLLQADSSLPLIPSGEARIKLMDSLQLSRSKEQLRLKLYAIYGYDLSPHYVFLDEKLNTFADHWSILKGWEFAFSQVKNKIDKAKTAYSISLGKKLTLKPDLPVLIYNAQIFDSPTGNISDATSILIKGNRIVKVGSDKELAKTNNVLRIDARGQMAIPGLWEMHGHMFVPFDNELMFRDANAAPLYLASGVTTVRDMGGNLNSLFSIKKHLDNHAFLGPRILPALYIDNYEVTGKGTLGVRVSTPDEAKQVVRDYAEKGIRHIKIYGSMTKELVDAVVAEARNYPMYINGHIPRSMTLREVIDSGYREIQHVWWFTWALHYPTSTIIPDYETDEVWFQVLAEDILDSEALAEIIVYMKEKNIALDPSITYFMLETGLPYFLIDVIHRYPAISARRFQHSLPADMLYFYEAQNPISRISKNSAIENMKKIIAHMHQEGVQLVIGSDSWGGDALRGELTTYVESGIPERDVLSMATIEAARIMDMDEELGSIEAGKLADFFLVDGDPTTAIDDLKRVRMVIKNGLIFNPDDIYTELGIKPCCDE